MAAPFRAFDVPAPHRRIDGFLGKPMADRLLAYAATRQADFVSTRVGNRKVDPGIRKSLLLRDLGDLKEELEARLGSVVEETARELNLSRITLARIELEMVAHGDGAFYRRHIDTAIDTPDAASHRALTVVYYFHRQPKGFSGGALRLHPIVAQPGVDSFVDIPPGEDTLVLFPSWAPHEVLPVSCPSGAFLDSRFAINCWFRQGRTAL